jgi:hypothetical protein
MNKRIALMVPIAASFGLVAGIYFRDPIAGMICFFGTGMVGVYLTALLPDDAPVKD